jgi:hypothetical protein
MPQGIGSQEDSRRESCHNRKGTDAVTTGSALPVGSQDTWLGIVKESNTRINKSTLL